MSEYFNLASMDARMAKTLSSPGSRLSIPPTMIDLSVKIPTQNFSNSSLVQIVSLAIAFAKTVKTKEQPTEMKGLTGATLEQVLESALEKGLVTKIMKVHAVLGDLLNAIAFGYPVLFEALFTEKGLSEPPPKLLTGYKQIQIPDEKDELPLSRYVMAVGYSMSRQVLVCYINGEIVYLPLPYVSTKRLVQELWTLAA